jgi:hypothetical protein
MAQRHPCPHTDTRRLFWLNQSGDLFLQSCKEKSSRQTTPLAELEQRLLAFQSHYEKTASPFQWTFIRRDLHVLLAKLDSKRLATAA